MKNIFLQRLWWYIVGASTFPVLLTVLFCLQKWENGQAASLQLMQVREIALAKNQKQALNAAVRRCFQEADHFYIDKHLETLLFLEPELDALQKILAQKNVVIDDSLKKRFTFLENSNRMIFSEGVVQKYPSFQETIETLVQPVEVSPEDIQTILARVEGVVIGSHQPGPGRPQLVVTEFKIDKKKISDKNEVYLLNLKLLKREFL